MNFLPVEAELFHANDKQADRYYEINRFYSKFF